MTTPQPRASVDHMQIDTPYNTARRYVEADLRSEATTAELAWLHAHPMLWLRVLIGLKREVETHIAKDKRGLAERKPLADENQAAWLAEKAAFERRTKNRLHFDQKVKTRMEEVKTLFSVESAVDRMLVGDVIADMVALADMAEAGQYDSVRDKSRFLADKWLNRFGKPQLPASLSALDDTGHETTVVLGGDQGDLTLVVRPEPSDADVDESRPPYVEVDVKIAQSGLTLSLETIVTDERASELAMAIETATGVARRRAARRGHYEWLATGGAYELPEDHR